MCTPQNIIRTWANFCQGTSNRTNLKHKRVHFFSNSFSWDFSVVISFQQEVEKSKALLPSKLTFLVWLAVYLLHFMWMFHGRPICDSLIYYLLVSKQKIATKRQSDNHNNPTNVNRMAKLHKWLLPQCLSYLESQWVRVVFSIFWMNKSRLSVVIMIEPLRNVTEGKSNLVKISTTNS